MKDKTKEAADDGWQLKDAIRQTKTTTHRKMILLFLKNLFVSTKPELMNENFINHLNIYDGR